MLKLCSAEAWILTGHAHAGCWWAAAGGRKLLGTWHVPRSATALSKADPKTLHPRDHHRQKYRDVQSTSWPLLLAATPPGSVWSHPSHTCAVCDSSSWSGALSRSPACALQALPSARGGARTRWAPRLTCFHAAPGRRARCCTGKDPCNGPHINRSLRFPRWIQDARVLSCRDLARSQSPLVWGLAPRLAL